MRVFEFAHARLLKLVLVCRDVCVDMWVRLCIHACFGMFVGAFSFGCRLAGCLVTHFVLLCVCIHSELVFDQCSIMGLIDQNYDR